MRIFGLVVLGVLCGCGVTADSFCPAYVDAVDARSVRCAGGAEHMNRPIFQRVDFCGDYGRALKAKTAVFDAAKASACLDALAKGACESTSATPVECVDAFAGAGAGAVGAACHSSFECGAAMYCDSVFGTPCPGQCVAMGKAGEDCSGTTLCAAGLSCNTTASPMVCVALSGVGGACGGSSGKQCAPPLYCGADGTCAALKTSGACGSDAECAPAFRCASKSCVARKKRGEACVDGQRECQVGLSCSGGTCIEQGQIGAACSMGDATRDGVDCIDGYCDTATKKCTAFKAPGASCTPFSFECGVALCPNGGTCPANGGACHVP